MTTTNCTDPRVPARDACVVRDLIERWAREQPDAVYAVFENGEQWSYAELKRRVETVAGALAARGVAQSDHVAVWLFGGREGILSFFATNYLGGRVRTLQYGLQGQASRPRSAQFGRAPAHRSRRPRRPPR